MAKVIKGIYNRRRPERTDYYRIIESYFDTFEKSYPDLFEKKYGFLRKEVKRAIYAFIECGIPENGLARVFCTGCGDSYFVSFSCRQRIVCPSCSTKRSLLFAERIKETLKPLSHRHVTFTIPKILRAYFRRNRKILKLLPQSAKGAMEEYFRASSGIEEGYTGGIYCIHSQGNLYNFHPHVHAIVLAGIKKEGLFYEQTSISTSVIAQLFKNRLLSVMLERGIITRKRMDLLLGWRHNAGFNVHAGGRIFGNHEESIENLARYMSRAALSVDRVAFNPENSTVTVYEKAGRPYGWKSQTYPVLEFMALLASHIPASYEPLVFYYGIYSSAYRGREKREKAEEHEVEIVEVRGKKGTVQGKVSSSWARLIQRVFEVDPLRCKKCGGPMKIIAFIVDFRQTQKILKHLGEKTKRPPPLAAALPTTPHQGNWFGDYMPSDEEYILDTKYED